MLKIKEFYSALELSNLGLGELPKTTKGIIARAKKENWLSRPRTGKGGGLEYAFDSLPKAVQDEIRTKHLMAQVKGNAPVVRVSGAEKALIASERDVADLTDKDRLIADSRLLMALLVSLYALEQNLPKTRAIKLVSKLSRAGKLPTLDGTDYNQICRQAVARKNTGSLGVGTRALHEWVLNADNAGRGEQMLQVFAPHKQGRPQIEVVNVAWLADFMAVYRNTNGVCVAEAYRGFVLNYQIAEQHLADNRQMAYELPSLAQVRGILAKIPNHILQIGRKTGASLRALRTYVKRDWSVLKANDVWVGDGHSLNMKVAHPDHGRPFTPELTLIMDTASRYIVGWSLSYSESAFAVADALRFAMMVNGIPAIYYSDNGGGQTNKTMDADIVGILPRLGVHHETGIPGNPQGRGIIERVMKTLAHPIARAFPTYFGPNADSDTVRQTLTAVDSLAKHQNDVRKKDKPLTPKQKSAIGKLPTWGELFVVIEQAVHWYNTEHRHSELGGATPKAVREYLLGQLEDGEYVQLLPNEARDMYRPSVVRVVQRAWISVYNNEYWHKALEDYDGKKVQVHIDQHDPQSVIVKTLEGKYLCDAVLNGNKKDAFPLSLVERAKVGRTNARLARLDDEAQKAKLELRKTLQIEASESFGELGGFFALQETQRVQSESDDDFVLFEHELKKFG
ncbi:Mu transposase C-terminal domain-containing protein [Moraxella caprae]|uniref:Mu transposase C-terminal domain-containing protein n=1 Tax=Moraxella caprae TaxID=90240 RepID=UPI00048FF5EC|nr:Mu transposase C-terminal domain-containing protein [Moraxella caprae]